MILICRLSINGNFKLKIGSAFVISMTKDKN